MHFGCILHTFSYIICTYINKLLLQIKQNTTLQFLPPKITKFCFSFLTTNQDDNIKMKDSDQLI